MLNSDLCRIYYAKADKGGKAGSAYQAHREHVIDDVLHLAFLEISRAIELVGFCFLVIKRRECSCITLHLLVEDSIRGDLPVEHIRQWKLSFVQNP